MSRHGKRKRSPSTVPAPTPAPASPRELAREIIIPKTLPARYPDTSKFAGQVIIEGNQADPSWAITKAKKAEDHRSTPDDMQLSVTTDGSILPDNKARSGAGYACVYTKPNLRDPSEVKLIEKAFYAPSIDDSNCAEGLGVIEGVHSLIEMLQEASSLLPEDTPVKGYPVVARVFSDSTSTLEAVEERRGPLNTNTTYGATMQEIMRILIAKSHELQAVHGFDVRLELHWVPSHCRQLRHHNLADRRSRTAIHRTASFYTVDGRKAHRHRPYSAYADLQRHLEEQARESPPSTGTNPPPQVAQPQQNRRRRR
ncbi:hypothetical protein B0T19DRAFT_404258 [Cercophora scortea]|uniref:RNase H type-1 domain-containing protein n=1 Tax=Cercophora scortea TaxID=314031 RepID=A0AAE0I717_9PEZI|nr:hypothetical protein B0T19DRAFT_404258 [Cercophora scortea]